MHLQTPDDSNDNDSSNFLVNCILNYSTEFCFKANQVNKTKN